MTALPTLPRLIVAVRQVAAKYPHQFIQGDDQCVYFMPNGNPSCIVGHAFASLGLTIADVADYNDENLASLYRDHDGPDLDWLLIVQDEQDQSQEWLDAVHEADARDEARTA